jgi:hypothetical protein
VTSGVQNPRLLVVDRKASMARALTRDVPLTEQLGVKLEVLVICANASGEEGSRQGFACFVAPDPGSSFPYRIVKDKQSMGKIEAAIRASRTTP